MDTKLCFETKYKTCIWKIYPYDTALHKWEEHYRSHLQKLFTILSSKVDNCNETQYFEFCEFVFKHSSRIMQINV